jgi:hypothetical protein
MIMDYNAQFSDNQTLVATATTVTGTNYIDFENALANAGSGTPIWVVCRVHTACTGLATIVVALQDCDTSNGTYITCLNGRTLSLAEVDAAGDYMLVAPIPAKHQRYLGIRATIGTSATAGTMDAYLCLNDPRAANTQHLA